jgi:phospholipid/cholesterol/gamma-HCH transport system substrate-binding protein
MKFKFRFADQIVGFFVIFALVSVCFVIIMLGRSQRWFAKDVEYFTVLSSANGLSLNMPVQYKGFSIGSIKSFYLSDDDNVEVRFQIHEEYRDRARQGSVVDMQVSPIGLGNSFIFHSGKGDVLDEGVFIPVVGSREAREFSRQGLSDAPRHDDSITSIVTQVSTLLESLNRIAMELSIALGRGSDRSQIGKIVGSVQKTLSEVEDLPVSVDRLIENINRDIGSILSNLNDITGELNKPDGFLYSVLDPEKEVYVSLTKSLASLSGLLDNLDKATAFLPGELVGIITELRGTLRVAEDTLTALTNNPLLRGGVPSRPEETGSTGTRGISF